MRTFDNQWEKVHSEREWGRYPTEEVIRFIARNYFKTERSKIKILDLGCGAGATSWFLAREGFATVGVDGSRTALNRALTLLRNECLNAEFVLSDLAELPFANSSFDAIIDSAAISANSTIEIEVILNECSRVLKPSGKLFSTGLFQRSMEGYGTGKKIDDFTFRNIPFGPVSNIGTVHFFSEDEIIKLWNSAGFDGLCIDRLERTERGGKYKVSYFMAEADKQGDSK